MLVDNRPRVFVSSTVLDFRDLRSAVRYWLEENGFRPHFSEFNDFPQAPDKNSYDSCLRAIDESDYFVLFVGGRVGGRAGPGGESITRLEYRHAYDRLRRGLIKVVPFVRKEVWDAREDRRGLESYLRAECGLDPEAARRAAAHPSRLVEDAGHVFDFLAEITRNHDMRRAAEDGAARPVGNWVYQFSSFRDVADALRTVMSVRGHVRRAALAANLKLEIAHNLQKLYMPNRDGYGLVTEWSDFARGCLAGGFSDVSSYKGKYLCWLGMFMIGVGKVRSLARHALDEALTSGEFLDLDPQTGRFTAGRLQQALLQTAERLRHLADLVGDRHWLETRVRVLDRYKRAGDEAHRVPNDDLLNVFAVHDRIHDLHDLFRAVYKALDGDDGLIDNLKLRPTTPITQEAVRVEKGEPKLEDVIAYLERGGR